MPINRGALVLALCLSGCSPEETKPQEVRAPTPEEQFYAKYPPRYVSGLNSRVGPAPYGDPTEVASAAITYSEHPCPKVSKAIRNEADGSITARCSNGERYVILKIEAIDEPAAMKCSALEKLLDRNVEICDAA